tara:strand:- start:4012 stop:4578 length:567 start_codon:yes stop_codon:yes gene_type:complete
MSDLTITSAGVSVSSKSPGSSISTGRRKVIRVTPTLETSAYAAGDVLFNSVAIPDAVREDGGCSKLLAVFLRQDPTTNVSMELIFSENAVTFGTVNQSAGAGDSTIKAGNILGYISCDAEIATTNYIDNSEIKRVCHTRSDAENSFPQSDPMLLQAASDSTSVYFAALGGGTVTYGADDLEFIFHIEY